MATYRNKNDDIIFYGGEFKLKVSMDTIGGYSGGLFYNLGSGSFTLGPDVT